MIDYVFSNSYINSKNKISKSLVISKIKTFFKENFPEVYLKVEDNSKKGVTLFFVKGLAVPVWFDDNRVEMKSVSTSAIANFSDDKAYEEYFALDKSGYMLLLGYDGYSFIHDAIKAVVASVIKTEIEDDGIGKYNVDLSDYTDFKSWINVRFKKEQSRKRISSKVLNQLKKDQFGFWEVLL